MWTPTAPRRWVAWALVTIVLAGCGSSGSDPQPASPATWDQSAWDQTTWE